MLRYHLCRSAKLVSHNVSSTRMVAHTSVTAGKCLAIRRETISAWERRAPLAPRHVRQLVKDGVKVIVQPSNRRAFSAQEYLSAGAKLQEDIGEASLIMGVKQVPLDRAMLIPDKTYSFFAHVIKAQGENMELLDTILKRNIRLIDYERMVDPAGARVVAFGQFAGIAGMINILHGLGLRLLALGHHTPFMHIGPAHNYRSIGMAKQAIRDAGYEIAMGNLPKSLGPLTFVFTGTGNVSKGARSIFEELPFEYIEPDHLHQVATSGATNKLYGCIVSRPDHFRRRDDSGYDAEEFQQHPERYISTFSKDIAPYMSVLINGLYYAPNSPRIITIPDAKKLLTPTSTPWMKEEPGCPTLPHRLVAIADISADIGGSIEFMKECTTIDKPFYLYDAEENINYEKFSGNGVLMCTVDIMPAQIPKEATEYFGSLLLPHVYDMLKSDAEQPLEKFDTSAVIKGATITSNGELTPAYQYIAALRENQRVKSAMRQTSSTSVHRVLILGSGYVVPPLLEHLSKDDTIDTVVASFENDELSALADKYKNVTPSIIDVTKDSEKMEQLVKEADLVVSLIPYGLHSDVFDICLRQKCNMITASYVSSEMQSRDQEAKDQGITCLGEIGLDPGLDHLIAMEAIDSVHNQGGKIMSYVGYTGGLPAPEFSNNPLRYKFSWSPEGVLGAILNPAKYIENGKIVTIEGSKAIKYATDLSYLPGFHLEGYANRDSTLYSKLYGIDGEATTIKRGTIRYSGFSQAMCGLIDLGLLSLEPHQLLHPDGPPTTWKQFMCELVNKPSDIFVETMKNAVYERLNQDKFQFDCVDQLGLFEDKELLLKRGTPLQTLARHLQTRLAFKPNERDVVIMVHEIGIRHQDNTVEKRDLRFVVYGDSGGHSAMAKTVGFPVGIAVQMMLDGEIQQPGILRPLTPDLYQPILKRLNKYNIKATEKSTFT